MKDTSNDNLTLDLIIVLPVASISGSPLLPLMPVLSLEADIILCHVHAFSISPSDAWLTSS